MCPRLINILEVVIIDFVLRLCVASDIVTIEERLLILSFDPSSPVLSKFPSQLLDRQCVESHLGKLVHVIDSATMEMMASDLGLSQVEVDDIQSSWEGKPVKQRLEMFKKWLEKNKSQATYRWVCHSVCTCYVQFTMCRYKLSS